MIVNYATNFLTILLLIENIVSQVTKKQAVTAFLVTACIKYFLIFFVKILGNMGKHASCLDL